MSTPAVPTAAVPSPGPPGPPFVGFPRVDVPPPGALYVARDDRLYVRVRGSVAARTLELRVRLMQPNGQIIPQLFTVAVPSDRTTTTDVLNMAEGYLLGVAAQAVGGAVLQGEVYVEAGITHEEVPELAIYQVLLAGYVSNTEAIGWPYGRPLGPLEGPGNLRSVLGTDPAAGVEVTEMVPAGATWRLLSFRVQLVTAVAAANRRVHLVVDDGANIFLDLAAADLQAASLTRNYNAGVDGFARVTQDSEIYVPLPAGLVLRAGHRIRTITTLLQAADQFGAPRLYVEEYLEA